MKQFFILFFLFTGLNLVAQNRWSITDDGGIEWSIKKNDIHTDHVEMSGKQVSLILTHGTDNEGLLICDKLLVFPMLRTIPNDTHASLLHSFGSEAVPSIKINGKEVKEYVKSIYQKGVWKSTSDIGNNATLEREISPSLNFPFVIEKFTIINNGDRSLKIDIEDLETNSRTHKEQGVYGAYEISSYTQNSGLYTLHPTESVSFSVIYTARKSTTPQFTYINTDEEIDKRQQFIDLMFNNIQFVSPDSTLNTMFNFAKIRAMESIYDTKNGLVHSPGGGRYYAAIWANDQAEYANPFFAYSGYNTAIESAMTSWQWFSKYMNPEYKPIPSSIIAEGDSFWNGAGDRGDQAMIAYGAARFALALGDKETAKRIWPLIEWCIEYSKRKINENGVVTSDSDELEGRFPAGDANLCTSSLLYDALISAIYLGKDIDISKNRIEEYKKLAEELHRNINTFFGANVQGYDTYRYYEGNDILRSWICIPLTVDIMERSEGTIDALFSPTLWTKDGLLTATGDKTFWDRSTLYGLRGAFAAGAKEKAISYLIDYSNRRLLGEHVPYAVEAWPEGDQRHLSAESALYCRVITEGLFGFRPTGLNSFSITPQLPEAWNKMGLRKIIAFNNKTIDIEVLRIEKEIKTNIFVDGKLFKSTKNKNGAKINCKLK